MPQRYFIVAITAVAALWLYIDRVCFSTLATPMKRELLLPIAPEPGPGDELSEEEIDEAKKEKHQAHPEVAEKSIQLTAEETVAAKKKKWADKRMSYALGAFFLTYAIFQIPMGSLADRYGTRRVLALSIAAWSIVTMATGFVLGFVALLGLRLILGITESGAYPAAAGLIKKWVPPGERGLCSSIVAFGGRCGGAIAPKLTALVATGLIGIAVVEWAISPTPVTIGVNGKPSANWRGVFVLYGFCGLVVALVFWLFVRDHPPAHAAPEDAKPHHPASDLSFLQRVALLARTRNMWMSGGLQFGVNVGWAFIITLLPTYLKEAYRVPLKEVGSMQSTALTIGCLGMLVGGVFTDWMRKKLGPKLGRSVPIGAALVGCAAVFFLIPSLPTAWAVVVALGVMAFLVDMHNPCIWSFAQDVGGRNVGAALGWGNMWGNFGAALSPVLLTEIRLEAGWNVAFTCCGIAFALAAVCGFLLDATKPVEPEPPVTA